MDRPIAHLVTVGVVEFLEAIEIEHHDADAGLGLRRARQPGLELPIERAPIGQPGQRIGVGFLLGLLEMGGVMDHGRGLLTHPTKDAPVFVGERARDRVVDHEPANRTPLEYQRTGEQRRQFLAVHSAAVGARREPEREITPGLQLPLE